MSGEEEDQQNNNVDNNISLQSLLSAGFDPSQNLNPQQLHEFWQRMGFNLKYPINKMNQFPTTSTMQQTPQMSPQMQQLGRSSPIQRQPQPRIFIPQQQPQQMPQVQTTQRNIMFNEQPLEQDEDILQIAKNRPRRTPKKVDRDYDPSAGQKKRKQPVERQPRQPVVKKQKIVQPKKETGEYQCPELPKNVLENIFSFLRPLPDFITMQRVSQTWNQILKSQSLWDTISTLNFSFLKMEKVSQDDVEFVVGASRNIKKLIFSDATIDEDLCNYIGSVKTIESLTFAFCLFSNISSFSNCLPYVQQLIIFMEANSGGFNIRDVKTFVANAKNLKELSLLWTRIPDDLNQALEFSNIKVVTTYTPFKNDQWILPFDVDKKKFGENFLKIIAKLDISPNTYSVIDQLQQDLYRDWNFVEKALRLGLDANVIIDTEKNSLLHFEMTKAEAVMENWNQLRREILGFQHETPESVIISKKNSWAMETKVFSDEIIFLLAHEANIHHKNQRKKSPLDVGKGIDNEIAAVEFLQEAKKYSSDSEDSEEDQAAVITVFPFGNSYFQALFSKHFIPIPKKKKRKIIQKEKPKEIYMDSTLFQKQQQQLQQENNSYDETKSEENLDNLIDEEIDTNMFLENQ